jgi:hypothetical protein
MNPPSVPRQQQQKKQQQQKTLRMQKHENTLEFHSRLIEAAEVRFSFLGPIGGRIGIQPRKFHQPCSHRVFVNVLPPHLEFIAVPDAAIREATLPHR